MRSPIHRLYLSACLAASGSCWAAAAELPAQTISLRVTVDAAGKVQSAQPSDRSTAAGMSQAASGFARKLTLAPARKDGVAVASETSLSLTVAIESRADGRFGVRLTRAINGPGVLTVGKMAPPHYVHGNENGALVVVGIALRADGTPDMGTLATEHMELRVPSKFAEARYLDSIATSLRGSRFELDKVDGASIPVHVSVSYRFGGGPGKLKVVEYEEMRGHVLPEDVEVPFWNAVSLVPGVELARIDYQAPAKMDAAAETPP